jgi:serine/threonine protein phosphatase PrpC
MSCPQCGETVGEGANFCEACGASLTDPAAVVGPTCASCGMQHDLTPEDGFCVQCGLRLQRARDHLETADGPLAAVTDRGVSHWRNEDAVAIKAVGEGFVIAVCDGVSSSQNPDIASQAACDAAADLLVATLATTPGAVPDAMTAAVRAAQEAVAAVEWQRTAELGPPSCTIVVAVLVAGRLRVAWLGDCRVYVLTASGAEQLTRDDSWATEQIDAGLMSESVAFADTRAHAITRWLGVDAPEIDPHLTEHVIDTDGLVLVCSDGLWNYLPLEADLAEAVGTIGAEPTLDLARRLTALASERGGHDNITVAIAPVTPAREEERTEG